MCSASWALSVKMTAGAEVDTVPRTTSWYSSAVSSFWPSLLKSSSNRMFTAVTSPTRPITPATSTVRLPSGKRARLMSPSSWRSTL